MDNEINNGNLPATDKQKEYVKHLVENATREQVSQVIELLKEDEAG